VRPALRLHGARAGDGRLPGGYGLLTFACTAYAPGMGGYPGADGLPPAGYGLLPDGDEPHPAAGATYAKGTGSYPPGAGPYPAHARRARRVASVREVIE